MPAQVPVRRMHGTLVPHSCKSALLRHSRALPARQLPGHAPARSCRFHVQAGQQVNQLEADQAAEATPLPQEQENNGGPRVKATKRGICVKSLHYLQTPSRLGSV